MRYRSAGGAFGGDALGRAQASAQAKAASARAGLCGRPSCASRQASPRTQYRSRPPCYEDGSCLGPNELTVPLHAVPLHSRGDTRRLGRLLADCLQPGDLVVLEGDFGAGKTFLARAIARGLGVPAAVRVTSPTFDLVHELPARAPLLHVDLYRLDDGESLDELGLGERIGADAVVLVEWGARFARALGGDGLWLAIAVDPRGTRSCRIRARGERGAAPALAPRDTSSRTERFTAETAPPERP